MNTWTNVKTQHEPIKNHQRSNTITNHQEAASMVWIHTWFALCGGQAVFIDCEKCLNFSIRHEWPEVQLRTVLLLFVLLLLFFSTAVQSDGEQHLGRHFTRVLDSLLTFPGAETDLSLQRGKVKTSQTITWDIRKRDPIINLHEARALSGVAAGNMGEVLPSCRGNFSNFLHKSESKDRRNLRVCTPPPSNSSDRKWCF